MAKKNGTPFINNQYPKTPKKSFLGKALKSIKRSFDNHISTHQQRKDRIKKSISRAQEAYENAKKTKESDLETYKKMIVEAETSLQQLLEKYPNYGKHSQI